MNGTELVDLPICSMEDIGLEITGPDAAPYIAAMEEYLSVFAQPVGCDGRNGDTEWLVGTCLCLKCLRGLDGAMGTFEWGLASGEGKCGECGWPCRAHHNPRLNGEAVFNRPLEKVLQYHPNHVTEE